ncbi:hypothetical protein ACN38_g10691 [Penicillium nordicum]|uniref:Uncharacterized protein n=1 Tax=Penicillium nordicum TaxID=229535 RepID=A0A0M8P151_9EURO|nr:hypothetical protein ACN38_g10691 [Penicillium nordicum]
MPDYIPPFSTALTVLSYHILPTIHIANLINSTTLSILIDPDRTNPTAQIVIHPHVRFQVLYLKSRLCYGNSGIHIFRRQIFRQMQASILLILVSDPRPGYTLAGKCGTP